MKVGAKSRRFDRRGGGEGTVGLFASCPVGLCAVSGFMRQARAGFPVTDVRGRQLRSASVKMMDPSPR